MIGLRNLLKRNKTGDETSLIKCSLLIINYNLICKINLIIIFIALK